jgi:hypothetical protein
MAKAPAAVDPLDELHTILEQCGIATQAAHNNLIANEGFTLIESMSCMTNDNDTNEMAKCLMSRTVTDGHVIMGTVAIKRIQGLAGILDKGSSLPWIANYSRGFYCGRNGECHDE